MTTPPTDPRRPMPELPTAAEKALYLAVLRAGRIPLRELTEQDAGAAARLLELGLLEQYVPDGWVAAVDPRSAAARLGAAHRAGAADLLARADRAALALDDLADHYDAARHRLDEAPQITHVHGLERIQHRLLAIEAERYEEVLAAQPGHRPAEALGNSRMREALGRGAVADILYQPIARRTPHTVAYGAVATGWGARLRVLDEPFARMMIFDRRVAVISGAVDNRTAAFIEDPGVIAHLVDVFQRDFARAERVPWQILDGAELPEALGRVGELLAEGLTQRAIASRLGIGERTVAAHIARLRERYGAQTLFQLGRLMRDGAR
ncbi:LuxR C-terminal-related transcriptional regulator [Kitasatospora sp. NPDC092948]|uniref:LuxR C-terminal-related transcriptional regulator n=1 Tax=Kitasatospora sp. NPDC092948 TaxID=3364088 RepID=UPI0038281886